MNQLFKRLGQLFIFKATFQNNLYYIGSRNPEPADQDSEVG